MVRLGFDMVHSPSILVTRCIWIGCFWLRFNMPWNKNTSTKSLEPCLRIHSAYGFTPEVEADEQDHALMLTNAERGNWTKHSTGITVGRQLSLQRSLGLRNCKGLAVEISPEIEAVYSHEQQSADLPYIYHMHVESVWSLPVNGKFHLETHNSGRKWLFHPLATQSFESNNGSLLKRCSR